MNKVWLIEKKRFGTWHPIFGKAYTIKKNALKVVKQLEELYRTEHRVMQWIRVEEKKAKK